MGKYNEKYFHPDNEMNNNQIEDLLNEGEEIIWRGRPKLAAFIWSKVFNMLPFALLWACVDGFVIYGLVTTDALVGVKPVYIAMIVGFLPCTLHLCGFGLQTYCRHTRNAKIRIMLLLRRELLSARELLSI